MKMKRSVLKLKKYDENITDDSDKNLRLFLLEVDSYIKKEFKNQKSSAVKVEQCLENLDKRQQMMEETLKTLASIIDKNLKSTMKLLKAVEKLLLFIDTEQPSNENWGYTV